jgi:hypothetical protein
MAMNKFLLNKDNARFLRLLKAVKEVSTLAIDFQLFRSFLYSMFVGKGSGRSWPRTEGLKCPDHAKLADDLLFPNLGIPALLYGLRPIAPRTTFLPL